MVLLLSLWCFSIFVNYYFQVSFDVTVILSMLKITQNTVRMTVLPLFRRDLFDFEILKLCFSSGNSQTATLETLRLTDFRRSVIHLTISNIWT